MAPTVRAARPDDGAAPRLLYVSAQPYYDAFAGSQRRALKILGSLWPKPGHTASYDASHVAIEGLAVVGAMAAFPADDGDELARRFLTLSMMKMPFWHWPAVLRHLRASAEVIPVPPARSLYIDALAVAEDARRRGVATALLREAEALATGGGLRGVSLDTGLQNREAQALYETHGFQREGERRAPDDRVARAIGGPGFVSYFKPV